MKAYTFILLANLVALGFAGLAVWCAVRGMSGWLVFGLMILALLCTHGVQGKHR